MRKEPRNFHLLQKARRLETFVEGEEEDQFSFRHHRERSPHMLALDQMLQLPKVIHTKKSELQKFLNFIDNKPQQYMHAIAEDSTIQINLILKTVPYLPLMYYKTLHFTYSKIN